MKFARTKQVMFTNNKGGVGKTTASFNIAKMFANNLGSVVRKIG